MGPFSNSRARSALLAPASVPAFCNTESVKPSKAAWGRTAASTASRICWSFTLFVCASAPARAFGASASAFGGFFFLAGFLGVSLMVSTCHLEVTDFRFKNQPRKIAQARGVKPPVQVIAFMLHHPCVKAARH